MYLIKNGNVHVGNGTVLPECDILTEGKTIKAVGHGLNESNAQAVSYTHLDVYKRQLLLIDRKKSG